MQYKARKNGKSKTWSARDSKKCQLCALSDLCFSYYFFIYFDFFVQYSLMWKASAAENKWSDEQCTFVSCVSYGQLMVDSKARGRAHKIHNKRQQCVSK